MNTPDPLIVNGQPIVVGRIVHMLAFDRSGAMVCHPMLVLRASDNGALRLKCLDLGDTHADVFPGAPNEAQRWHWPDANLRQCQGRP